MQFVIGYRGIVNVDVSWSSNLDIGCNVSLWKGVFGVRVSFKSRVEGKQNQDAGTRQGARGRGRVCVCVEMSGQQVLGRAQ